MKHLMLADGPAAATLARAVALAMTWTVACGPSNDGHADSVSPEFTLPDEVACIVGEQGCTCRTDGTCDPGLLCDQKHVCDRDPDAPSGGPSNGSSGGSSGAPSSETTATGTTDPAAPTGGSDGAGGDDSATSTDTHTDTG
ncbi:MAG: hypothetical protein V3V08_14675 [Nannocystaceae bacterium]